MNVKNMESKMTEFSELNQLVDLFQDDIIKLKSENVVKLFTDYVSLVQDGNGYDYDYLRELKDKLLREINKLLEFQKVTNKNVYLDNKTNEIVRDDQMIREAGHL